MDGFPSKARERKRVKREKNMGGLPSGARERKEIEDEEESSGVAKKSDKYIRE